MEWFSEGGFIEYVELVPFLFCFSFVVKLNIARVATGKMYCQVVVEEHWWV